MFQLSLFVVASVAVGISGYLIKVPTTSWQPQTVPVQKQEWIYFQKRLMPLFENICEDSNDLDIISLSNDFGNDFGSGNFLNPEIITRLQNYQSAKEFLPKGQIFTELDPNNITELRLIFEVLYFAKDFQTFYKAAAWFRQNINCGLYVDAIYLAILSRKDTKNLLLPPPYELLPNYFINKDAVIKSSLLLANEELLESDDIRVQGNSYIVDANYSDGAYENQLESLSYFNEDIGLNSFYFLQKLQFSPWLNISVGLGTNYGEHVYHTLKQLVTRYDLERYSNGLPELEDLNWNLLSSITYYPMLIYSNGKDFGESTSKDLSDNEDVKLLQNVQNNIATVATHMSEKGYSKEKILNHLMDILVTSNNSYENLAFKILGDFTSEQRSSSVLSHYMTTARHPMFWKITKKIVNLVDCALDTLPGYNRNDLIFPGVEIVNIDIKKLVTHFEYFQFDVTDALKTSTSNTKFQVKIGQYRLNHKPFTIKLNISSLVIQKGFAKIFLGPKVIPGQLYEMKNLFFLLDCFEINLKKGKNMITRTSDEMNLSGDLTSLKMIKKHLEDAEFGLNVSPPNILESQTGFPQRLVLPKGSENGLPFQIFIIVLPYTKPSIGGRFANIEHNTDAILAPGYPLDLNIDMHQLLDLPNTIISEVVITHKAENQPIKQVRTTSNYNNAWTSEEIEKPIITPLKLSARPSYTMKKEPFDYKSKRGQYGKKDDYLTKRTNYNSDNQDIYNFSTDNNNIDITKNKDLHNMEVEIKNDLNVIEDEMHKKIYVINSDKPDFEKSIEDIRDLDDIIWTGDEIDKPIRLLKLSSRPDFTIKNERFNYNSKRGQYQKKADYLTKRGNYGKGKQDTFQIPNYNETDIANSESVSSLEIITNNDTAVIEDIDKTIYSIDSDTKNFKKPIKKDIDNSDNFQKPITSGKEKHNTITTESVILEIPKIRNPTVYDYLFNNPFEKYDIEKEKKYE